MDAIHFTDFFMKSKTGLDFGTQEFTVYYSQIHMKHLNGTLASTQKEVAQF